MGYSKITVRLDLQQHNEIKKRAKEANLSVNQYMIECCLGTAPRQDKVLSELMRELCGLELCVQKATDIGTLKKDVREWRRRAILIVGGSQEWPR